MASFIPVSLGGPLPVVAGVEHRVEERAIRLNEHNMSYVIRADAASSSTFSSLTLQNLYFETETRNQHKNEVNKDISFGL